MCSMEKERQTIFTEPVEDGEPGDPMEPIVALWYQLRGYITASNKWFWVWRKGKKLRGHKDIDLVALNNEETVLVSVTQNLDDKIPRPSRGDPDLSKIKAYFRDVEQYLSTVQEYQWLVDKQTRRVKKVLVYNSGNPSKILLDKLKKEDIRLKKFQEILSEIIKDAKEKHYKHRRITNRLLKLILEVERLRSQENKTKKR